MMKNKFKEFHESLLRKEQHTMDKLKEAFKGVEDMFHIMRDSPKQLSIKTDNWRNEYNNNNNNNIAQEENWTV